MITFDDLDARARSLMRLSKDVENGNYTYQWPQPGNKLKVELIAQEDRSLRFFLDINESRRSSSIVLGVESGRKASFMNRESSSPIVRVDMCLGDDSCLRHTNPDGTLVVGSHVHLALPGYGISYAYPIGQQSVVVPCGGEASISSMFFGLLEACTITDRLTVNMSLEV